MNIVMDSRSHITVSINPTCKKRKTSLFLLLLLLLLLLQGNPDTTMAQ